MLGFRKQPLCISFFSHFSDLNYVQSHVIRYFFSDKIFHDSKEKYQSGFEIPDFFFSFLVDEG